MNLIILNNTYIALGKFVYFIPNMPITFLPYR